MDEKLQKLTIAVERLAALVEKNQGNAQPDSTAAEILLSLVPLLGVIFGATLLFFFLLWHYRLRREMIRTGQYTPMFANNIRLLALMVGLLGISSGLPMTILFLLIDGLSYALLGGLLPLCAGIGCVLFYGIARTPEAR